jgi:hypothetical protein
VWLKSAENLGASLLRETYQLIPLSSQFHLALTPCGVYLVEVYRSRNMAAYYGWSDAYRHLNTVH